MKSIALLILIQCAFCADQALSSTDSVSNRLSIPLADYNALYKAMVLMATWPFLPINTVRLLYNTEAEMTDWKMSDVECLSSVYFEYHNNDCPWEYLCKIAGLGMIKMPDHKRGLSAIFEEFSRRLKYHKDDNTAVRFDQVFITPLPTAREHDESRKKQKLAKLSSLRSSKRSIYYEKLNDTFRTNFSNESLQKLICIIYYKRQVKWTIEDIQRTTSNHINDLYRQFFTMSVVEQVNQIYADICFKLTTSDNLMSPLETVLSEFYYVVCELYDHEPIHFYSI